MREQIIGMTIKDFDAFLDDAIIARALLRINRAFLPDRALLSWTSIGEGKEGFKWTFVNREAGRTENLVYWVPSILHPLSGEDRDKVLSGKGAGVLLPMVLSAIDTVPGAMLVSPHMMKISSNELGMVEVS